MNIALFASAFYPSLGGVEELVRQLAHAQCRQGHAPIVLTNRWPRDLPHYEKYQGIPVYRPAMRAPEDNRMVSRQTVMYWLRRGAARRACVDALRRHASDIIHIQCVSAGASYALGAKMALGLPLVVTLQGELTMDADELFQRSPWAQDVLRASLRAADAITACSRQTLEEAEAFYGESFGARGRVIYNGIHLDEFKDARPFQHPRPYILAIGRHVAQKGFDVLLRAYAQLSGDGKPTVPDLIIAGNGPEHDNLQKLANELGLQGRAHFPGRAERAQTVALFAGCEFFVLPSRHEPFGIVNLEAMACGKAVIASRVGGVPEFVGEEREGLLVPPADPAALALAMQRLLSTPDLAARLGEAGRRKACDFDWDAIALRYAECYADARARMSRQSANGVPSAGPVNAV